MREATIWQNTEVTRRLGLDAPIVQGPFGGGISSVELTSTVSEAGGLGSFGVHHFSPDARYTGLTRAFSGRLARGIRNRFMGELAAHEAGLPQYPVQSWFAGMLKRAAIEQNRPELMPLWSGQAAPLLKHRDARSLIKALVEEAGRLIG